MQSRNASSGEDDEVCAFESATEDIEDGIANSGQTFTMFSLLPKELRLSVWDHALTPRIISVYRREDSSDQIAMQLAFLSQAETVPVVIWIALACAEVGPLAFLFDEPL